MTKSVRLLILASSLAGFLYADTLYLKDGQAINGTFLSGTSRSLRFIPQGGRAQNYPISNVENIIFGANSSNASSTYRNDGSYRSTTTTSTSTRSRTYDQDRMVPQDTVITVRMIDPINSDKNNEGDTFRASLDEPLVVNGREIAPRGADATVQVIRIKQGGGITGNEEVGLRLTEIRANGMTLRPTTSDAEVASSSRGSQSAKVIGGTAVVGAILGAIAGGGKGAAIGAAAGAGAGAAIQAIRGQRIQVPSESKLDFRLAEPLAY